MSKTNTSHITRVRIGGQRRTTKLIAADNHCAAGVGVGHSGLYAFVTVGSLASAEHYDIHISTRVLDYLVDRLAGMDAGRAMLQAALAKHEGNDHG